MPNLEQLRHFAVTKKITKDKTTKKIVIISIMTPITDILTVSHFHTIQPSFIYPKPPLPRENENFIINLNPIPSWIRSFATKEFT
jgi:hypothetical protein